MKKFKVGDVVKPSDICKVRYPSFDHKQYNPSNITEVSVGGYVASNPSAGAGFFSEEELDFYETNEQQEVGPKSNLQKFSEGDEEAKLYFRASIDSLLVRRGVKNVDIGSLTDDILELLQKGSLRQ